MYKCDKCNLEFKTFQAKANHHRWHHLGYQYKNEDNKVKADLKRHGDYIEEDVKCINPKCKNTVHIKYRIGKKKNKYYCSRSCSNTRIHSDDTKDKIKNSLIKETTKKWKEPQTKICIVCNEEFLTTSKKRKTCSHKCSSINNIRIANEKNKSNKCISEKISKSRKKAFKDGRLKVTGGTTKWYDYKNIRVQGTYELRTCYILDEWKENRKINNWEYTNDRFQYTGTDGKKHMYLMDFKIFENDGTIYYLETKGWEKENDKLKWKSVTDKGYNLKVWFDSDIIENEKQACSSVG